MTFRNLTWFAWLAGWILLGVAGGGVEYMLHLYGQNLAKQRRLDAVAFAGQLRARVDRELNAVLYQTNGLSSYLIVRHGSLNPRELEDILATIYASSRHIRNFGIAVGYRLTYVFPHVGNENAIGLDYRTVPDQWPAVQRAIDGRKGVLTERVNLVQGGQGIIYRLPIYIDGEYWGLLSTVIDSQSFLGAAFRDVTTDLFDFTLRGSTGVGGHGQVLWGRAELLNDPEAVRVESDNGWCFAVKPAGPNPEAILLWLVRGLGWAFALVLALMIHLTLRHRESLAYLALADPLTGLPNRRLLNDRIERAVGRLKHRPHSQCALLYIDLDGFKAINDQYGHEAGDVVLKTAAKRAREVLREEDTLARWGGDEFAVLVEDMEDNELPHLVARLRDAVEIPIVHESRTFRVGASIGWAVSPDDAVTAQELMLVADRTMYRDKRGRKERAE